MQSRTKHLIFKLLGHTRDCAIRARGASVQLRTPDFTYKVDFLETVKCINWPSGMKDWRFRRREYNWPDGQTIQLVLNTGCDVILTPNAEIMLSFSKAETVLIRSFTPVQQKVYHVMRCFAKAELFPACSWLCAFHIKTLMFWSIERKPTEWWNDNNVVVICCQLLYDLYGMLCNRCCQHYFLPNCNLFRHFNFDQEIVKKTKAYLYSHDDMFTVWLSSSGLEEPRKSVPTIKTTLDWYLVNYLVYLVYFLLYWCVLIMMWYCNYYYLTH